MSVPGRIQRRRGRGWRMPEGAIYVGRPSRWGNPFRVTRSSDYHGLAGSWFVQDGTGTAYHPDEDTQRSARRRAVELFALSVSEGGDAAVTAQQVRDELAGHDLVCWCPVSEPCHADVLLAIARDVQPVVPRLAEGVGDPAATRRQDPSARA